MEPEITNTHSRTAQRYRRKVTQDAAADTNLASNWYAIYTKYRFEKKIYQLLKRAGYTVYLPLVKQRKIWSDRLKTVTVPLLPCYIFIKLPKNKTHLLYNYTGFVRFVSFEGRHCEIKEDEIDLLKKIERNGLKVEANRNTYQEGDQVKVVKGPLVGFTGKIYCTKGAKVVFQLNSIRQSISVELYSNDIQRLS